MKTTVPTNQDTSVAASVAPEDLRCGDYVTALNQIYELPSFLWCSDAATLPANQPVRAQFGASGAGIPLRVTAICLPFVCVKSPRSRPRIIDVRRIELVRLKKRYAKDTWTQLKKKTKRKNGR